jgi:hypothetical protein
LIVEDQGQKASSAVSVPASKLDSSVRNVNGEEAGDVWFLPASRSNS